MNQASLPQELLQWLFRVLQPEYIDPRLAYHDVAITLQSFPSLKPRTRVFTTEAGESKLLLCLYGSIPSPIGGKIYKIPIELWIPHEYPIASPYAYVVPTEKMLLQPGNHVDSNGKCYLPYLANWGSNQEDNYGQSTIAELCECLSEIFSNEPPVFAKPRTRTPVQQSSQLQPTNSFQSISATSTPAPALPPKLRHDETENGDYTTTTTPMSPPPLPPLPEELRSRAIASPTLNRMDISSQQWSIDQASRYEAFEQPNIMDNDSTSNGDDNERLQILTQLENLLNQINQFEITEDLNKFNSNISKIKYSITKFDKIFQYEFHNLDKTKQNLEENEEILTNSINNAEKVIQHANSYGQVNVDEVICAETVVFNQLYDLVADDQAISDTIYALGKAHDNGNISLNSFTKHTRNLAREQFMKKALISKISMLINLETRDTSIM